MQCVANLFACAAIANVRKRFAEIVTQHPQRHDALIHFAHLPRAGNDAATVYGCSKSEPSAVFLNQPFAGKLGQPVKRARALGRAFFAEDAAEAIGVNAMRIKRDIYMISAFLTALAGTFYVQYIYFIDPQTAFNFNISVEAALVSIVGGVGTLWGPVLGTVLLEATSALLQSWLGSSIGGVQLTVYSLILIAVILWRPTGLLSVLAEVYARIVRTGSAQTKKAALDG